MKGSINMSEKKSKFITRDILGTSIKGAFVKLNPMYATQKSSYVRCRNWFCDLYNPCIFPTSIS